MSKPPITALLNVAVPGVPCGDVGNRELETVLATVLAATQPAPLRCAAAWARPRQRQAPPRRCCARGAVRALAHAGALAAPWRP